MEPTLSNFLSGPFLPHDLIEVRLVETWEQAGKRASEVKANVFGRPASILALMGECRAAAAASRSNVFVGCCPRPDRRPGKSFTVRRLRTLWADLDDCRPSEVAARCQAGGVPHPSCVVDSGRGVHLWWWLERHVGFGACDEVKRGQVQRLLRGIAAALRADHTTDLARVLRMPFTFNRKNERNGQAPTPCTIAEMVGRRYLLADLWHLAAAVPARAHTGGGSPGNFAELPAGTPWAALTPRQRQHTEKLIAGCDKAAPGTRSEADYALLGWAAKINLDATDLWDRVKDVGKFSEAGYGYFARSYVKAIGSAAASTRSQWDDLTSWLGL